MEGREYDVQNTSAKYRAWTEYKLLYRYPILHDQNQRDTKVAVLQSSTKRSGPDKKLPRGKKEEIKD